MTPRRPGRCTGVFRLLGRGRGWILGAIDLPRTPEAETPGCGRSKPRTAMVARASSFPRVGTSTPPSSHTRSAFLIHLREVSATRISTKARSALCPDSPHRTDAGLVAVSGQALPQVEGFGEHDGGCADAPSRGPRVRPVSAATRGYRGKSKVASGRFGMDSIRGPRGSTASGSAPMALFLSLLRYESYC